MPRHILFIFILFSQSFIASVDGCSCFAEISLQKYLAEATHVFIGTVTHIEFVQEQLEHRITFQVEKVFKGVIPSDRRLIAKTALDSASCGVSMRVGEKWQVWTYGESDNPSVSLCSPTTKDTSQNINFLNRYASSASSCRQIIAILILPILVLINYA
ncbi:unnamed protein product [Adineta ricciae]|uniref:NTR domain-containing protein n=1 Tax=Adineta ricciae TaxID=249248 RepID=A0A814S2V7_ADIRI|nr:unnamed protein product [Adineta ricciae]CAF1306893.1 unnamed protein product [Adineta ricciae]